MEDLVKKTGLNERVIVEILNIVKQNEKYKFYIFGSRAKGKYKDTSDIDIAIFENVANEDKFKIMNEFDKLDIIYKIDLVFVKNDTKKQLLESIKRNRIKLEGV